VYLYICPPNGKIGHRGSDILPIPVFENPDDNFTSPEPGMITDSRVGIGLTKNLQMWLYFPTDLDEL